MEWKSRKVLRPVLIIVIILVAIRIALPYVVKWYLNNKVLNNMEAYRGHVEDVDLALWRGAYAIDSLNIVKIDTEVEEPFINIPRIDLSVQWKSLWDGEIVGEVVCYRPRINFAFSQSEAASQTGAEEDWTQVVKDLMPIRINRFAIIDGELALSNVLTQPSTDLPLESFNLEILDIQNVTEEDAAALPSTIIANGAARGYNGTLSFNAKAMLLKEVPDFDYDLRFENVELKSMNALAKHYTGMDFEKGTISIYSEMAMRDQAFEGYVKPLIKDMRIFSWKEEDRSFGQWFKEFFGEGLQEIFENQKRQQFATRVPISGQLDQVTTDVWITLFNVFKNAYIEAFRYELDKSVDFSDVAKQQAEKTDEKKTEADEKEAKKQERKAKREERKKAREAKREEQRTSQS